MMLRAIYEHGQLRLLDPINLNEGQEVRITVQQETDFIGTALANSELLLTEFEFDIEPTELNPEERKRLGKIFASQRSSLQDIQDDRGEY